MTFLQRIFLFSLLLFAWSTSDTAESTFVLACFAVVAGRKATADGSVLVGHNEQDNPPCLINFDRVPRRPTAEAMSEKMRYRRRLVPPGQTASFLWSQCVPKGAGDSCLNEYGVAIVSNKCPAREDGVDVLTERGELRDGGIGYLLRRLVAEQATTAREGVAIAGDLVERFGYAPSGRTYVVADPDEAWLMAVVPGRRWVAQRVPDDAVAVLPNVYIIRHVDLTDTANFLGSADLVDYATKRGWFNPATDGPFDFRKVYREKRTDEPDPRRWWAHRLITGKEIPWPPEEPLPLWIRRREPLDVSSMVEILRSRGGRKPLSTTKTVEAAVFQLRANLPRAIGCVYWRVTCEPSSGALTPWYLGVSRVPDNYHERVKLARRLLLDYQFNSTEDTFRPKPELAWWKFKTLEDRVHEDYEGRIGRVRPVWEALERRLLAAQNAVEQEAMRLWANNPDTARDYLARYCDKAAAEACREADRLVAMFEEDAERWSEDHVVADFAPDDFALDDELVALLDEVFVNAVPVARRLLRLLEERGWTGWTKLER
ncbi:MAG: C69 family dipeptidase, partial [Pirellulales bacterium]|nr:C69 family dipeptidase [Pirellulales bacterium]